MKKEFNIAGFGGQGILYLGQVIAYAGMLAGREATWIPSYGPEMRGGTANCMLVLSDDKVRSPLVYNPDIALIFNKPSLKKYGPDIKKGGTLLFVSELIDMEVNRSDLNIYKVPAKTIADEIGAPMSLNMVMLGVLTHLDSSFAVEHAVAAIRDVTPAHRKHLVDINLKALQYGLDYAEREGATWA